MFPQKLSFQVACLRCNLFTLRTRIFQAFVNTLYVCFQISFMSCAIVTPRTWIFHSFMFTSNINLQSNCSIAFLLTGISYLFVFTFNLKLQVICCSCRIITFPKKDVSLLRVYFLHVVKDSLLLLQYTHNQSREILLLLAYF